MQRSPGRFVVVKSFQNECCPAEFFREFLDLRCGVTDTTSRRR